MKSKYLVSLIIFVLVFSLVGCGTQTASTAKTDTANKTTLQQIKDKGVIVIGTSNDAPFCFIDTKTGKLSGIDAMIIDEIAKKMGVKVEVSQTEFSSLIAGLKAKKFDIIVDAMYITDKRKAEIDFSDVWYKEGEGLVVTKDNNSLKTLDDLKGKTVGVQSGTVFLDYVQKMEGLKGSKVYDSQATALLDLNNKRIDAVVTDSALSAYAIKNDPSLTLKLVTPYEPKWAGNIGAGVRKEDTDLLAEINKQLAQVKSDGKVLEALKAWGLGEDNVVK